MKKSYEMITNVSELEKVVLKEIFVLANKVKNVNFPKELLVEKGVLTKKQLNAVINNLKAKNIIEVTLDLFGFNMVSMSYDGIKFCKKLNAKKS